jgi:redox-sensitive bicupin YhaK (pirin superfamily)
MLIEPRTVKLTTRTGVEVRRTVPHAKLKMIGAWCFVDHFGPTEQTDGMVVAAHPHTGLQTATWLFEGNIEHRDSIGSVQLITPGQLNLMTAGHGISHSEVSLADTQLLHAVQLWIALPKGSIDIAPAFEHQSDLPKFAMAEGASATVIAGEFMGHRAQTRIFSPLLGVELRLKSGTSIELPLNPNFEHGFLAVQGEAQVNQTEVPISAIEFIEVGATSATIAAGENNLVLLLLGGEPFGEKILMWWNFIGRTHADIVSAREQWNAHESVAQGGRFGQFADNIGGWLPAPELPNVTLNPR